MTLTRRAAPFFLAVAFSSCLPPPKPISKPIIKNETPAVQPPTAVPADGEIKSIFKKNADPKKVRIGLRVNVASVSLACDGGIRAVDPETKESVSLNEAVHTIESSDGVLVVDGVRRSQKIKFSSREKGAFLHLKDRGYRGEMILIAHESSVTVINELGLDDYLKGVLPREAVVTWPLETLKVQAVASRTYVASHLGAHGSQGFDLCSDVHCQVYGGMAKEHPRCNQAVEETEGEILTYDGKPIGAYFHSNCGGSTEDIDVVWGGQKKQPYLPRKKCSYGTEDPRYTWKCHLSNESILTQLRAKTKVKGSQLKKISIAQESPSGRAQMVSVKTEEGVFNLKGNEFRIALNPEIIRSTLWTSLNKSKGGYEFSGRGWGHGVGMCQWGAKGQAEAGRSYKKILNFYYPHTDLEQWKN